MYIFVEIVSYYFPFSFLFIVSANCARISPAASSEVVSHKDRLPRTANYYHHWRGLANPRTYQDYHHGCVCFQKQISTKKKYAISSNLLVSIAQTRSNNITGNGRRDFLSPSVRI